MFDLNEPPEHEGPSGRLALGYYPAGGGAGRRAAAAAAVLDEDEDVFFPVEDEDGEEEELEVEDDEHHRVAGEQRLPAFYARREIALLRGEDEDAAGARRTRPPGLAPAFLQLGSGSPLRRFSRDWQQQGQLPLRMAAAAEGEAAKIEGDDDEVTVAALDPRAILEGHALDSAVSLVVPVAGTPPDPGERESGFWISPRPEKMGQRTPDMSRKQQQLAAEKRGGGGGGSELRLDCSESSSFPAFVAATARKGKRARDGGDGDASAVFAGGDAVLKLKKRSRPPSESSSLQAYEAGPSLSMGLDQGTAVVAAKMASPAYRKVSGVEGSRSRASPALATAGEAAVTKLEMLQSPPPSHLRLKPSLQGTVIHIDGVDREGDGDLGDNLNVGNDARVSEPSDVGKVEQPFGAVGSEKPFWQGKLSAPGFTLNNDVAAYCSEQLPPDSKLWRLPHLIAVEDLVKIEEFLDAARKIGAAEPFIRLRFPADAANNERCFSSLVTFFNSKIKGRGKGRPYELEMHSDMQNGSHPWRSWALAELGKDFVFLASFKLKYPKEGVRRPSCPMKLYLVLRSSCEAVSKLDREVGGKLLEEMDWSYRPDEDLLVGFLCESEEAGHPVDSTRAVEREAEVHPRVGQKELEELKLGKVDVDVHNSPVKNDNFNRIPEKVSPNDVEKVSPVDIEKASPVHIEKVSPVVMEKVSPVHTKNVLPDDFVATEMPEATATVDMQSSIPKDGRDLTVDSGDDSRRLDKGEMNNESLGRQHSTYAATEGEGHENDRDRHRDRDQHHLGGRKKGKRVTGKDIAHKHGHHRSSGGSIQEQSEHDRNSSHRNSQRIPSEGHKSDRDRAKEKEKLKGLLRESERERLIRKRDRSGKLDMRHDLSEKRSVDGTGEDDLKLTPHQLEKEIKTSFPRVVEFNDRPTHKGSVADGEQTVQVKIEHIQLEKGDVSSDIATDAETAELVRAVALKDDNIVAQARGQDETGVRQDMDLVVQHVEVNIAKTEIAAAEGAIQNHVTGGEPANQTGETQTEQEKPGIHLSTTVSSKFYDAFGVVPSDLGLELGSRQDIDAESEIIKDTEQARLQNNENDCGNPHPQETLESGKSPSQGGGQDGQNIDFENEDEGHQGISVTDGPVHVPADVAVKSEDVENSDPLTQRPIDADTVGHVHPSDSKTSFDIHEENVYYERAGQQHNEHKKDYFPLSRTYMDRYDAVPSPVDKVGTFRSGDPQSSLVDFSSMGNRFMRSSSLTAQASCEVFLEDCDKETRGWLGSKQNASYLLEEFGVRISRFEEQDVNGRSDARWRSHRGPLNVRVFLATEKAEDRTEAKWFISQAADVLRALASRGVFSKCLWYQGQVQRQGQVERNSVEQAPSIQVIVKQVKGEDGKNLERIQERTGVMIGVVVLDPNVSRGAVRSTARVIGLRLRGAKKKGIKEATKEVQGLLSRVAELFSKANNALMKLNVDLSSSASPSGIPTPLQKDLLANYSPITPVTASISHLGSFKSTVEDSSSIDPATLAVTHPIDPTLPSDSPFDVSGTHQGTEGDGSEWVHSEADLPIYEESDLGSMPDLDSKTPPRPLLVSNLPECASASMLKNLFEDVLKKFGLSASHMILDVQFVQDEFCAIVQFTSDEFLVEVLKTYNNDRGVFCGLKLELGSSPLRRSSSKSDRMFVSRAETPGDGRPLDYDGDDLVVMSMAGYPSPRAGRKRPRSGDHRDHYRRHHHAALDSDAEDQDRRLRRRDGSSSSSFRHPRYDDKPKPLYLTELMRNASARSIHGLFEDLIKKYVGQSLGSSRARAPVRDVRYIPSRGCAFVDLSSAHLVECMLELHASKPELFHRMKMEVGRRHLPPGDGEEPLVKRSAPLGRYPEESSHGGGSGGYGSGRRSAARGYYPSVSPPPSSMRAGDYGQDYMDEYYEDADEERQQAPHHRDSRNAAMTPTVMKKRRSDPERTVYADRLPEKANETMIRAIFESVVRGNIPEAQREALGEDIIAEVRHVPTKFCAFIVFAAEELTRLVLQLYNQEEQIFQGMRLKPHFHSRMEDLYRDDVHADREDGPSARLDGRPGRSRRGMDDYHQNGGRDYNGDVGESLGHRGRNLQSSSAHRAVAATAFKEVDRGRSVYVDRIPERWPESTMRDTFEKAIRRKHSKSGGRSYGSRAVSQVTFFRDKFDPEKLCAFVELEHEDLVKLVLDAYNENDEAFSGVRVRPAVKYGN